MKQQKITIPAVGGSSLLVIFAVLCLTVLALTALTTAQADRRMAQSTREATEAYYAADLQAEEIFARLRNGEQVESVTELDGCYTYEIPVTQYQTLSVKLQKDGESWTVLQWQTIPQPEAVTETMPVWQGE